MFKKCQIFLSYSIKTQEKFKTMNSINRKYLLIQTCYFDQQYLSCLKFKIILERKKKNSLILIKFFLILHVLKKGIPEFLNSGRKSWTLDAGSWTLDAGLFTLNSGLWALDSGRWTLDSGRWILDTRL